MGINDRAYFHPVAHTFTNSAWRVWKCVHAERLRGKEQVVKKAPCLVQGSITEQRVGGGAETPVADCRYRDHDSRDHVSLCGTLKTVLGWESQRTVKQKDEILESDRKTGWEKSQLYHFLAM